MLNYLVKRIFTAVIVILGVSTAVFLLIHVVPGDPVQAMLGETALPGNIEAIRIALGLDLPMHQQWLEFMKGLLRFDLGESLYSRRAVAEIIYERLG
ncbi:MAG: ABC transporter permease, partial [Gammaproteobacteria bacterium]